jgi:hypothetical protein
MKVSGQLHAPTALPSEKDLMVPLDKRVCGPQSRSWRGCEEKNSHLLPGLETPINQAVAQRYTDWAIAAHVLRIFALDILPSG